MINLTIVDCGTLMRGSLRAPFVFSEKNELRLEVDRARPTVRARVSVRDTKRDRRPAQPPEAAGPAGLEPRDKSRLYRPPGRIPLVLEPLTRPAHIRGLGGRCRPGEVPARGLVKVASDEDFETMSRVPSLSSPFLLGFDEIERVLDRVAKGADGYPPYNIERLARDAAKPGAAAHHACRRRLHPRPARRLHRGKPAGDPRAPAGRQEPAISPPRHRRAPIPAHLRAGGRHGGAGRRPEERAAVDRSGPAAGRSGSSRRSPSTSKNDEIVKTGLDRVKRSMKGVEGQ